MSFFTKSCDKKKEKKLKKGLLLNTEKGDEDSALDLPVTRYPLCTNPPLAVKHPRWRQRKPDILTFRYKITPALQATYKGAENLL